MYHNKVVRERWEYCSSLSACTGCSQPLCYTPDTAIPNSGTIRQTCCNFYLTDGVTCTPACNQSYFPDANRTCSKSRSVQQHSTSYNGFVLFTPALCTLNCQNGGTLRSDMCGCSCTAVSTGSDCSSKDCFTWWQPLLLKGYHPSSLFVSKWRQLHWVHLHLSTWVLWTTLQHLHPHMPYWQLHQQ